MAGVSGVDYPPVHEAARASHRQVAGRLLIPLIGIDGLFMALHLLQASSAPVNDERFSLATEGGYADLFQFTKYVAISLLLLRLAAMTRVSGYAAWALVFFYLFVDDAFELHETLGASIARYLAFTPPFNLRPQDIGELIVSALAGSVLLMLIAWSWWRGSHTFRRVTMRLLLLIAALAFFGVLVDMLHIAVDAGREVSILLESLEDGGELVVASMMLTYAYWLSRKFLGADRSET